MQITPTRRWRRLAWCRLYQSRRRIESCPRHFIQATDFGGLICFCTPPSRARLPNESV